MTLQRFTFRAMACDNELQLYAADVQTAQMSAEKAIAEVKRIESTYSRYRDDTVVSHINRMAGKSAVDVDQETALLLNLADDWFRLSGGLFDITSGVLRQVWNFRNGIPPSARAVAAILARVGWDKAEWDGRHFRLMREGMEIDFGGIGKEYAVDRAAEILLAEGISSGLVNLGGDVRILGPHPNGEAWPVHIIHPRKPDSLLTTIDLACGALTTSGDYQRFFEFGGRRYCHILNPRTGWPVNHWQSATIVAPECTAAGCASTITMLLEDAALPFLEERGAGYLLVDQEGKVHEKRPPTPTAS